MSHYKFGDIVINHHASQLNPHRRGIVVRVGHNSGRLNHGRWVECTDGVGAFWKYGGDDEHLEIVGSVLKEPVYECCNDACPWRGPRSETVHPKHDATRLLCPECHEVVEAA